MRIKVQFISEEHVPSAIIEVKFLPRVGEILPVDGNRQVEVTQVLNTETDKRYSAVIKGKLWTKR